jgi:hypothetical protein
VTLPPIVFFRFLDANSDTEIIGAHPTFLMYALPDVQFSPRSLEGSYDFCWGLSSSSDEYVRLPKTL